MQPGVSIGAVVSPTQEFFARARGRLDLAVPAALDDHSAEVTYDEKAISSSELVGKLRDAGFMDPQGKCWCGWVTHSWQSIAAP